MIIWDEVAYSIEKAEQGFGKLSTQKIESIEVNNKYKEIRKSLVEARDKVLVEHNLGETENLGYKFDLIFGLELYTILASEFNFTIRDASKDDIWRFLQIEIIPDIVYSRWGLHEGRFYKLNRRIWLKTIWWYIHLSWNKDKSTTYMLLKENTTDTIMHLVERPGLGYNVELYREIMKKYGEENDSPKQNRRKLFHKALIMNTARVVTVSPELVKGGVSGYVDNIFEDVKILG